MARLKEYYNKEIKKYLKSKLGLENVNEVPKLIKIVVNMGVGESVTDSKKINNASEDLMQITGQKPMITSSKNLLPVLNLGKALV